MLAISVEVDNDVSAQRERGIDAAAEGAYEPAGAAVSHDLVGTRRLRHEGCSVRRAVVDDDHAHVGDVGYLPRHGRDDRADVGRLVERGDHYRQSEAARAPRTAAGKERGGRRPSALYSGRWTRSTFRTASRRSTHTSSKPGPPFTLSARPSLA